MITKSIRNYLIASLTIVLVTGIALISSDILTGQALTPINGLCGHLDGQTLTGYDSHDTDPDAYCIQWELSTFFFYPDPLNAQWWWCRWINGWTTDLCSNNTIPPYTNTGSISSCGEAHGENFASTQNLPWQFYSNMNNRFLGKLCEDWSWNNIQPKFFTENSIWREWRCNTSTTWSYDSCSATRYFDARCGNAANTGNNTAPTANLCSPGYVASVVSFDNNTHLRSWQCNGWGGGTPAQCTSWLNGNNTFSPMCNASLIQSPTITYPYYHLNNFVGSNACIYGSLNNRSLSSTGIASWNCMNNNVTSATCGNVALINTGTTMGDTCNSDITFSINSTNGIFDSTAALLSNNLCSNGGYVSSFTSMSDRWRRRCGVQNCEAMKSTQFMCWRATNQPTASHPTQWLCETWIVSTVKMSNNERWWICTTNTTNIQAFNNSSCTNLSCVLNVLDFYNGRTAVCRAPRIANGQCKWQTQINPTGYATPDDVLQGGLCESGIPDPLIPSQDTLNRRWSWTCKATNALGTNSPGCYAKVKLPQLTIDYTPHITSNAITSVTAAATGFNPVYVSFDTPVNQRFRLFTQNGYFIFHYHDRAGNTGQALAVVENIQNNLPTATIVSTPSTPTSGNVIVSLTWFNRPYVPIVTFTGACLTAGTCVQNSSIHPYLFTVTFSGNTTGEFILTDQMGLTWRVIATVNNIDRIAPTANIQYNITTATRNNVTASIANASEPITIVNNGGASGHVFTGNGSFVFQIRDVAWNITSLTASVSRISRTVPSATVVYSNTTTGISTNVIATLTNFTNSGTTVVNNSGRINYNFTHNGDFLFILRDAAGNTWTVLATVDNIDKPIVQWLLSSYTSLLCDQRTPPPIDTRSQEWNYHIHTVVNNCVLKTTKWAKGNRYFYPRKKISRGEYLTAIGRMIRLTTTYSGTLLNSLSSGYMQALFIGGQSNTAYNDADVRWLLASIPVTKKDNKRKVDMSKPITATEANTILWQALRIIGNRTDTRNLINQKKLMTKAQAAYAIGTIISQYQWVALWNHHIFMQQLNEKLVWSTPQSRRIAISKLIQNIQKTPRTSLYRLWLEPRILLEDLRAIAIGDTVERKPLQIIDLDSSLDSLLMSYTPSSLPVNNTNDTYQSNFFNFWSTF